MTNTDIEFFIMMFKLYFMYIPLVGGMFALVILIKEIYELRSE